MKSTTLPQLCGVALTAMCAAGLSHWWSVEKFSGAMAPAASPVAAAPPAALAMLKSKTPGPAAAPTVKSNSTAETKTSAPPSAETAAGQKRFYESLVSRMESLQNQNRDLLDQLAETNRDLMKLEFRVDTHSESFRPLPVTEDQPFTSLQEDVGVLPPRAEPVPVENYE